MEARRYAWNDLDTQIGTVPNIVQRLRADEAGGWEIPGYLCVSCGSHEMFRFGVSV